MTIKKLIILGFCAVLVACSTGRQAEMDGFSESNKQETATQKGVRYLLGRGVPQNDAKAFSYFNEGADEGDPFAQNELAYMYAAGKGTEKNDVKAFEYYQKAASHGLSSAEYNLGLLYLHGMGTPQNRALGMQWVQKSAAHGFEPAKLMLKRQSP